MYAHRLEEPRLDRQCIVKIRVSAMVLEAIEPKRDQAVWHREGQPHRVSRRLPSTTRRYAVGVLSVGSFTPWGVGFEPLGAHKGSW